MKHPPRRIGLVPWYIYLQVISYDLMIHLSFWISSQAERIINFSLFLNWPFNAWKSDQFCPLFVRGEVPFQTVNVNKDFFSLYSGIYLWVLGQADVSWSERLDGRRTHFEYEIYLKDCMTMWGKGLYLSKCTSRTVWPCGAKVCTSPNLSKGLHDHVGQRFVPLQIYLKDFMTMWGKGLYLSSWTLLPCGFVALQFYLKNYMAMWPKGL